MWSGATLSVDTVNQVRSRTSALSAGRASYVTSARSMSHSADAAVNVARRVKSRPSRRAAESVSSVQTTSDTSPMNSCTPSYRISSFAPGMSAGGVLSAVPATCSEKDPDAVPGSMDSAPLSSIVYPSSSWTDDTGTGVRTSAAVCPSRDCPRTNDQPSDAPPDSADTENLPTSNRFTRTHSSRSHARAP